MEIMETMKELSKNCPETENIYTDIIEFDLGTEVEKLKEENGLLEDHIDSLKKDIDKLAEALRQLKEIQKHLAENISSLFLTAKMELERKDRIIDDLQRELNDIIFRRDRNKRKSLCSSPVNAPKRGRYDNSTDHMNYINENNQNYIKNYTDKDSEKVRDIKPKNEPKIEWESKVKCHQYDRNDEHDEYRNKARFQPKSYAQNTDDGMKFRHRQENRFSNHDRNKSRDRNGDSYRTRRNALNIARTDYKEQWPDVSNRISGLKKEEDFSRCSSDNEQGVQNECLRIPKLESIKLEKELMKEKSSKPKTENKKPVRKKLLAVEKLERELKVKRALMSDSASEDSSRNKAQSNGNKRRNYFADHMDHIMDTVLLDINETKILTISKEERNLNDKPSTGSCHSRSEEEENATVYTHNQLSSFENLPTISPNVVNKCYLKYNLPSRKAESKIVSEPIKQTLNETGIRKDDLPAQSFHEKIEKSHLLQRKSDQVIKDELDLPIENATKIENGDFDMSEGGIENDNWKNHYQLNSFTDSGQKLSEISNRMTLEINSDERVTKTKFPESICNSRSYTNHEKKEGNDINRTNEFTDVDDVAAQETQIENTSKDNESTRKATDIGEKQDEQPTNNNTEAETGASLECDLKENQETNPPCISQKLTPSSTLPKLNSRYRIPKKVKKVLESEPSEKSTAASDAQRNLVLISMEATKISYERTHKDTDSKNENLTIDRRKSVPKSFLRQKPEATDESIRSKSRERYSSSNHYEDQAETGRHCRKYISPSRYRIDHRRDNYTRIKNLCRESLKGKRDRERRSRNSDEECFISEKKNASNMKHSRRPERRSISISEYTENEIKPSLCSQRRRKSANNFVVRDTEKLHVSKKDCQTIFLEKELDYDRDSLHPKDEKNTTELSEKNTETATATEINDSVGKQDASRKPTSKKIARGESLERNPAEQGGIATTNGNHAKIPDSFATRNLQNTDGKEIIDGKFSHENVAARKDYLNDQKNCTTDDSDSTGVKNTFEAAALGTTVECAANKHEKVSTANSSNELPLKPVSSKIVDGPRKDSVKEIPGDYAESCSQKRANGKLPMVNTSKYSLETNSTRKNSEEVKTVPSIEEREVKATGNTKTRNMPDIFSQEVCGQRMPNLMPSKQTLHTDPRSGDSVTAEQINSPEKNTIHSNSVQTELADNKKVEEVTKEKEKQLSPSVKVSLKVQSKVEEILVVLDANKESMKDKDSSSSSELKTDDSIITVVPKRSPYQKTIESSLPAQTPVRKRITPIRVDDSPVCSFENILEKNRMPSFVKDLAAPNASPLSLTHDGDIPILHLEENNFHITSDDGTQKSFDRNIMNLLDTMNMSNLECDMTKFQDCSEKDDRSRIASESKEESDNVEVLEASVIKETFQPVAKSEVMSAPSTEPLVSTAVDSISCKNESICGNGVQNSSSDLRTPTSNSRQNSSMIGRRRRVRLVAIN